MTLENLIKDSPSIVRYVDGNIFIDARVMYEWLGSGAHYIAWIRYRICAFSLKEGIDYIVQYGKYKRAEYFVSFDAAEKFFIRRKCRSDKGVYKKARGCNKIEIYDNTTAHLRTSNGGVLLISPEDIDKVKKFQWSFGTRGYGKTEVLHKSYTLSRYLMDLDDPFTGYRDANYCVDHIDCDPVNNRRSNLRICTRQQNRENIQCRGYSRMADGSYVAYIRVRGKLIYLGRAQTEAAAQILRRAAEIKYRGEFAPRRGKEWLAYALN